jgi:ATP-dependent DNA ligase
MTSFFGKKGPKKVLSFDKVFETILKIPETTGKDSTSRKINLLFSLFTIAEGVEVKYIVRFL